MKVRLFLLISALSILFSVPFASAQSTTHSTSLPSSEEIRDLTTKAGEKVQDFKKLLTSASPFLEKEKVAEYSKSVDMAETIIRAMDKNGPTAYGLVALVTTLDDIDLDALRSSLQILSKIAAGQITGEANHHAAFNLSRLYFEREA